MNASKQLISDGEQPSTMRVLALIVVVPVMVVWTVLCIKKGEFIIPDARIITLIVSVFGSKAIQSFAENISGSSNNQHPTNEPPV
jgi:hypothetical protein